MTDATRLMIDKHIRKFIQREALQQREGFPDDFYVLGADCRENLLGFEPERAADQGLPCYLDFDPFTGFKIKVGLPVDPVDEESAEEHSWARANFRWVFLRFLEGHEGDAANLRKAAALLRQYADMTDYVASENEQGRYHPIADAMRRQLYT